MTDLQYRAADAAAQAEAYVAALMVALGTRDPLQVLAEMPTALRHGAPAAA